MQPSYTTKTVVVICAIVAVAAFFGGYVTRGEKNDAVETPSPTPGVVVSVTPTVARTPVSYTVKLTPTGLSPALLSIRVGDSVTLRNNSVAQFWPASNPHPTHTDCPGFDAMRGLNNGESYTLTFTKVQTCGYHNHLDPANSVMRGTITVR